MPILVTRQYEPPSGRSFLWWGLLLLLPLVCAPRGVGAQPTLPVRSWSDVNRVVQPGMPLRVGIRRGAGPVTSTHEGTMLSISDGGLMLRRGAVVDSLSASLITRIERADARSRRVWRLGVPLGALAGGVITLLIDAQSGNPEPGQAFGIGAVLIGAPVGAITAASWPVTPLYVAPPNR
jgi:hypothetical protein